jgi:drug/metabolite transporter (DMT)-like permease
LDDYPAFYDYLFSPFLAEEREPRLLAPALIVSLTLTLTYLKSHHLDFKRYGRWLILAVMLMALEAVIIKLLLAVYSPAGLYFIRTLLLALVFTLTHPPELKGITKGQWQGILGVGVFGTIFKIVQYTAYSKVGMVITTMILVLSPFLVLLADRLILKERLRLKYILGMVVIGATIGWALLT